jgi:LPS export ABC transporter protein LptC
MKKSLLVALSLCLFSLLFFFLAKGERGMRQDIRQKGGSFIEGLRIVNRKNGAKNWTLLAKRADISENGEKASLTDITMKIENRDVTVYADRGLYGITDKKLAIDGKAVARGDNYSLTVENAVLDSSGGDLKTDGPVLMEGKTFSIKGSGMDTDNSGQKVRILKNVEAVFYH